MAKKEQIVKQLVRAYLAIPDPLDVLLATGVDKEKYDTKRIYAHMSCHEAQKELCYALGIVLNLKPDDFEIVTVDRKRYKVRSALISEDIKGTHRIVVVEEMK